MAEIIQFQTKEAASPHLTGDAFCIGCGHKWTSVCPVGTTEIPCPECKTNKGRLRELVVYDELHYHCKCNNTLFAITKTRTYCPNCGISHTFD